jgi:hypothetical protein
LLRWGETPNFTSHLRCICLVAMEKGLAEPVAAEPLARSA